MKKGRNKIGKRNDGKFGKFQEIGPGHKAIAELGFFSHPVSNSKKGLLMQMVILNKSRLRYTQDSKM